MVAKVQIKRTSTPDKPPLAGSLAPGELAVEMAAPTRLWVGVPTNIDASGMKLLNAGGVIIADIAPASPTPGTLWWESDTAILWIWYMDADTGQWVQAAGSTGGSGGGLDQATADGLYVNVAGDTMMGELRINASNSYLNLDGDTDCGIFFKLGSSMRWLLSGYDDFSINRYDTSGNWLDLSFNIDRTTGVVDFSQTPTVLGVPIGGGAAGDFLPLTGGTLTGSLIVTSPGGYPQVALNADLNFSPQVLGQINGVNRWTLALGDGTAENGSDEGSQFSISSWSDSGTFIGTPLLIHRGRSDITLAGRLFIKPTTNVTYATLLGVMNIGWAGAGSHGISMKPVVDDTNAQMFNNAAGSVIGNIYLTPTSVQFNTGSAAELKEDLKSFDAGNIVDNTKVYDFKWRSTSERAYGVIAQEANEVYPQAVTHQVNEDASEWWGIDYSKYVPVLLQELKALRARVAEQAKDIAALKAHTKMPSVAPRK